MANSSGIAPHTFGSSRRALSLKVMMALGGVFMMLAVCLTAYFAATALHTYRVGGTEYQALANGKDLIADYVPPPLLPYESFSLVQLALSGNAADLADIKTRWTTGHEEFQTRLKHWDERMATSPFLDSAKWKIFRDGISEHGDRFWSNLEKQVLPALEAGNKAAASNAMMQLTKDFRSFVQFTTANDDFLTTGIATREQESLDASSFELNKVIGICAALFFMLLGMVIFAEKYIVQGIVRLSKVMLEVAKGDLTVEVPYSARGDEIGGIARALEGILEKTRAVIADVQTAANNVATGSDQLAATADQLSQGSTEQASATEEASASMEEMTSIIKQTADNSAQTEVIARRSALDAEASGVAVEEAVVAMRTIADKILVVQEIARQTDLLALNAAVEAARAGEHGRGFSVVASEVRKLAERSQIASEEISLLSSGTMKAAQRAGEMLGKLVPDIKKTSVLVSEITSATREQTVGANQINTAIHQLDKVAQQNAAMSQQASSTSEALSSQSSQMQRTIAVFRIKREDNGPSSATGRENPRLKDNRNAAWGTVDTTALRRLLTKSKAADAAGNTALSSDDHAITTKRTAA